MDFYIKKGATLPSLKMEIVYSIDSDYDKINSMLDDCAITFSMVNVDNKTFKIANKTAKLVIEDNKSNSARTPKNYFLQYDFTEKDTNKPGTFICEFVIDFLGDNCGKLKLPLEDTLYVNIQDSITKTELI